MKGVSFVVKCLRSANFGRRVWRLARADSYFGVLGGWLGVQLERVPISFISEQREVNVVARALRQADAVEQLRRRRGNLP